MKWYRGFPPLGLAQCFIPPSFILTFQSQNAQSISDNLTSPWNSSRSWGELTRTLRCHCTAYKKEENKTQPPLPPRQTHARLPKWSDKQMNCKYCYSREKDRKTCVTYATYEHHYCFTKTRNCLGVARQWAKRVAWTFCTDCPRDACTDIEDCRECRNIFIFDVLRVTCVSVSWK